MGVLGQGGPWGCCHPSGNGTFTAALSGKRSSHFSLTANFDVLMKSEIIPSDFFSSENVAAAMFYRPLELGPAMILDRNPFSDFSVVFCAVGVAHSS